MGKSGTVGGMIGNRDGDDQAKEADLGGQVLDGIQKRLDPGKLGGLMQKRTGSVGAIKRAGGSDKCCRGNGGIVGKGKLGFGCRFQRKRVLGGAQHR